LNVFLSDFKFGEFPLAEKVVTVLVVDHEPASLEYWTKLLNGVGVNGVIVAKTGEEAVGYLESASIAIINWDLAGMGGAVFVQRVKSKKRMKYKPILVYSAQLTPEDVQLTKELGLENFFSFPFDESKIVPSVKDIVEKERKPPSTEFRLRKMEEALADQRLTDVLKIVNDLPKKGPHLTRTRTILGETYIAMGNFQRAELAIKDALKIDPEYQPAQFALARYYSLVGKHDDAIRLLDEIARKSPRNIGAMINLGSAFAQADRTSDAKSALSKVKKIDDTNQVVNDELGKIAVKEGNLGLAAQLLADTENGNEIARFYNSMGISLIAKGNFEKGIETYRSAIKLLGKKAKTYLVEYNMALAYKKKGDYKNCFEALCRSYMTEPSFEKGYASIVRTWKEMLEQKMKVDPELVRAVKSVRLKFMDTNPQKATQSASRKAS